LYADDGTTQLSQPKTESTSHTFAFTTDDFLTDIVFSKGVYKTILLKANVATGSGDTTGFYLKIANGADQFETIGLDSGETFDANLSSALNFYFTSPYAGGTFKFDDRIVEMKVRSDSPSGSQSRSNEAVTARWDLTAVTSDLSDRTITAIKFTSKTGLPSGATSTSLYKLYEEGGILLGYATAVDTSAGTVTFGNFSGSSGDISLTVPYGTTKEIYLTVDTSSPTIWTGGTGIQWTVAAQTDVEIATDGTIGYGGTTWSLPADAYKVVVLGT
jgi:hypothetical protein